MPATSIFVIAIIGLHHATSLSRFGMAREARASIKQSPNAGGH